jgi:hexosaminidase
MKRLFYFFIFLVVLISCEKKQEFISRDHFRLIPEPQFLEARTGEFLLDVTTKIYADAELKDASDFLRDFLSAGSDITPYYASKEEASIYFLLDPELPHEGYTLDITKNGILITSRGSEGAFYAVQSLRQLLPVELESSKMYEFKEISIPNLYIKDSPAFDYRGMHLDVGRHFFPKEFIKKYISWLSMLKMNYFHWHLTEDQGWRIEIRKYPKLTSHGAYRPETLIGHYNEFPQRFDGERYGGYYTQDDIREIVEFAERHKVTIIPEIEMPGHSQAAISTYPELGCTGYEIPVATKWGVFEDIYCPNEQTFVFLKDVLTEVMDLFPGEYIHIGGDEAPKKRWRECDHCQQLIKELGLKDEHELQSYFIKEIEKFINSHGKKIIGWDEILEGGLAPNATVMSWRGVQGAVDAAKEGHDVILTPTSHCYFDYYQAEFPDEPLAIGGYLPLKKVYAFNPVPEGLNEEESEHVLGAQGNVWTEYIKTEEHLEYMVFPRILAMSEVVWKGPDKNPLKKYPNFIERVESYMGRLDVMNVHYANHLYEIEGEIIKSGADVSFKLSAPSSNGEIFYSINQSGFDRYTQPIKIDADGLIKARFYKNEVLAGHEFSETVHYHKAITSRVSLNVPPHPTYGAGGDSALINGISGSDDRYGDREWLGFWGDDLEIVIILNKTEEIRSIRSRFFNAPGQWIHAPETVTLSINDHEKGPLTYTFLLSRNRDQKLIPFQFDHFESGVIRSNKVILKIPNFGIIPEGSQGAGNKAWTFIDEIIIE